MSPGFREPRYGSPRWIKEGFKTHEPPALSLKDKLLSLYLKLRPSLKVGFRRNYPEWAERQTLKNRRAESKILKIHPAPYYTRPPPAILKRLKNTILITGREYNFALAIANAVNLLYHKKLYRIIRIARKPMGGDRTVIVIGGLRGGGKSTITKNVTELLAQKHPRNPWPIATIELDAYFKKPSECRAIGGWDNPRNSRLREAAKAVRDFIRGKKISVPVGKVSDASETKKIDIDPDKSPMLIVEGIHALYPSISKYADLRCFVYIPPGLQEVRTWMRDLLKPKAKQTRPEHYLGMNARVRELQTRFILPRLKDIDIFYEQRMLSSDLDAIARMLNLNENEKEEFRRAWHIVPDEIIQRP